MANTLEMATAAELERRIKRYKSLCAKRRESGEGGVMTWPELACFLGTTWAALSVPEKAVPPAVKDGERERMLSCLHRERGEFEALEVSRLYDKDLHRGAALTLKNVFGWKEKQEVDASVDGGLDITLAGGVEQYSI